MDHKGVGQTELARLTGIPKERWTSIRSRKVRASTEELEACIKLWPEFAYWLATGQTIPEVGQISPELEETRKK